MPTLGLSAHDLLTTPRAERKRLDFDRPVDDDLIRECLEYAVQAPTGSNSQGWRFLVVTDEEKKAGLADLYRRGRDRYTSMGGNVGHTGARAPAQRAAPPLRRHGLRGGPLRLNCRL